MPLHLFLVLSLSACKSGTGTANLSAAEDAAGGPLAIGAQIQAVRASQSDGGKPEDTLDNKLNTHWRSRGEGQWIQFDLGKTEHVDRVLIAWQDGDKRQARFTLQASQDGEQFETLVSTTSSGSASVPEPIDVQDTDARFIRIIANGSTADDWNGISEVDIILQEPESDDGEPLPVHAISVSSSSLDNVGVNTLDNNLQTRWSAAGADPWIQFDLGAAVPVAGAAIGWYRGDARVARFNIEVSLDGQSFLNVYSGEASGTRLDRELTRFPETMARYVRIVGRGNTQNGWTSITEVDLLGPPQNNPAPDPEGTPGTEPKPTAPVVPAPDPKPGVDPAPVAGATPPNFKVAFLGDTRSGSTFESVLRLVKSEKADLMLAMGDLDYSSRASAWIGVVNRVLGPQFPVVPAKGNHDTRWNDYIPDIKSRISRNEMTLDDPDLADRHYTVDYQGVTVVTIGDDKKSVYPGYIKRSLDASKNIWKICSWHKNQRAMQLGGKGDSMGWEVYEACREGGAIIATGHEHSYSRTKTLTSMARRRVDPSCSDGRAVCIGRGRTIAFVAGTGGAGLRAQRRCETGCEEWASMYTTNHGATYGALFIVFHVDGDPRKAAGYFKNIKGEIIDRFTLTAE